MPANKPNDLEKLIAPVWQGNTVYEESFFALMPRGVTENDDLVIPLLYRADEILSVTSATRAVTLTAARIICSRTADLSSRPAPLCTA